MTPARSAAEGAEPPRSAYARWWADHPTLRDLRARIDAPHAGGCDAAAHRIAAARPLLEEIGWVEDAVAAAIAALRADPWFEPPLRTLDPHKQLGLVLFDDGALRISVQRVPLERIAAYKAAARGARSIGFTGALTLQRVIRAGGGMLDLWEAAPLPRDFSARQVGRCARAGTLALADGALFAIDGRSEAWTIARQTGDIVLLQATARCADAALAAEYDAASGIFLSASATDGADARMQLMATLLRVMGRKDAAPAIAACAAEGSFHLRWHLIRELAALDRHAVLPLLRRARTDPHPELRAAAAQALAALAA